MVASVVVGVRSRPLVASMTTACPYAVGGVTAPMISGRMTTCCARLTSPAIPAGMRKA